MKNILDDTKQISIEIEHVRNLSLLLEDYFYNHRGDNEYNKHQSLSTAIVERINVLDKNINKIIEEMMNIRREN